MAASATVEFSNPKATQTRNKKWKTRKIKKEWFRFMLEVLTELRFQNLWKSYFEQPAPDDFAIMLHFFSAVSLPPKKTDYSTEPPWALCELKCAIHRLQSKNSGDDIGLVW